MRYGLLDGVVDIEHRVIVGVTGANEPVYEWRVWREDIFVSTRAKRGREHWSESDKQRYSETVTEFRAHLSDVDGVDASMRIRFEGQYYDIKNILPDHSKKQDAVIDAVVQGAAVQGSAFVLIATPVTIGAVGQVYQTLVTIVGGEAPFTFSLADDGSPTAMPAGLGLVQAQEKVWALEGIPTESGVYPISIVAEDGQGRTAALAEFTLTISPAV